ncbi:MAG: hypothetical protein ABW204_00975 [Microbacteriaceae bacterium]
MSAADRGDRADASARSDSPSEQAPRARRPHRRVRTEPVPGSDPNPAPEPRRHTSSENDARLRADKPPHWG